MPLSRHAQSPSTSSLRSLPARFTVPPLPPRIHRRLKIRILRDGVALCPAPLEDENHMSGSFHAEEGGVLVRWGIKATIETEYSESSLDDEDGEEDDEDVYIGGVLGTVKLWDAAYLLVFMPSRRPPFPLFSSHLRPRASSEPDDDESREAGPSSHEVHTLRDIHAIPLVPQLAVRAVDRLRRLQAKHTGRKRSVNKGLKWNLPMPSFSITGAGAVPNAELEQLGLESEEDDDDDGSDTEGGHITDDPFTAGNASRASLPAPEADETPDLVPSTSGPSPSSPDDKRKNRFSLGWGRYMPKLGKPKPAMSRSTSTRSNLADESSGSGAPPTEVVPPVEPKEEDAAVVDPPPATATGSADAKPPPATTASERRDLEAKIISQIIREYSSGGFFYSLDFDLTHSLQHKRRILDARASSGSALANLLGRHEKTNVEVEEQAETTMFPESMPEGLAPAPRLHTDAETAKEDDFVEPDIHVPLWRRLDKRFFWNEALMKDFIDLGLHAYIVPVMQGWVQSSSFAIPVPPNPLNPGVSLGDVPVDLVVISRRSKDRAGLRYQRRGIDDEGHVANMVETEMIVRAKVEGKVSLFSFVQVRGSIPLKWSQSPMSMKPPPVLEVPVDQSYSIANLHFDDLRARYGPITIINLSEQTGKEAVVTNGYRDLVDSLGRKDLQYIGFDFHAKCHGMKWENISELVKQVNLNDMGYMWQLQGDVVREQKGAFRTNCIDCLDRTNVVQSALARQVLSSMLTQLGLILDPSTSGVDRIFNDVWANNGDTISLCYAHTSALKGDFVRTGKRDLSGMLHDGVSSLSRMFYGAVSDYWAQAVISFMLGHRNLGVFSEFLATLQSSDASQLVRLSRVRAAAVETSSARVLSDGEQRIAGWVLLSPEDRNVKLTPKLEEKVLLLTKVAIYVVSFNYALEKVNNFTRVPLASLTSVQKGAYILSPLQEAGRDAAENSGFLINFSPANESSRYSTYSIRNKVDPGSTTASENEDAATPTTPNAKVTHAEVNPLASEFFAFKVLPREFVTRGTANMMDDADDEDEDDIHAGESCKTTAERIVRRIKEACNKLGVGTDSGFVVDRDVVSLSDAQASTSILARMDYAMKRFLWL